MKHGLLRIHLAKALLVFSAAILSGAVVACVEVTPTTASAQDVLVEYHQSGGFVGLDDRLVIGADRRAVLTRRDGQYEFVLDEEDLNHIIDVLDQADFLAIEGEYLPADTGADLIAYTISYRGHTVRATDTAVPESVQPIIDALYLLVDTEGRS